MTEARKQEVMKRLQEVETAAGTLTPDAVVADAANPDSPLHSCFEWDDSKAAHQYRLDQARILVRLRTTLVINEISFHAPSYVRTPEAGPKEQGYTNVMRLRDDIANARLALRDEIGRVMSALERARNLAAVMGLSGEVEAMIADATRLQAAAYADDTAKPMPRRLKPRKRIEVSANGRRRPAKKSA